MENLPDDLIMEIAERLPFEARGRLMIFPEFNRILAASMAEITRERMALNARKIYKDKATEQRFYARIILNYMRDGERVLDSIRRLSALPKKRYLSDFSMAAVRVAGIRQLHPEVFKRWTKNEVATLTWPYYYDPP